MGLRPYQMDALEAVKKEHASVQSTLVYSPTGTGKTVMFCELARRTVEAGGRVMVLVDRTELVHQTYQSMRQWAGVAPDIEQAELAASTNEYTSSPIVVATVQTLRSGKGKRRERFAPDAFDLLICDEAHLSITKSTIETIEWFKQNENLRVVGFTATPKRQDGKSLGQLYDTCAYTYDIAKATGDGWLVPCKGKVVHIEELDFSRLPGGRKDWTNNEIARYMEINEVILGTAQAVVDKAGDRSTLVFCARVSHAERVAERINFLDPNTAAVIHGNTPKGDRRSIIQQFNAGSIKRIINCGVLTTGFDSPRVEVIVNARPTKSWALFTQIVGRALRPLPGIVDQHDTAEARRQAIADSEKPSAEIISIVGRDYCMELVGPVDVLAGSDTPPGIVERAKELMDAGVESPEDALIAAEEEEREAIEAMRNLESAPIRVHATYTEEEVNLYGPGEFKAAQAREVDVPAQRHVAFLIAAGFSLKEMRGWSGQQCAAAVEVVRDRHERGLATKKQCNVLKKIAPRMSEQERRTITKREASRLIAQTFGR